MPWLEFRRGQTIGVLVLVGDGPDYDALRAQTQRLGVRTVFARDVDDDALPAYYAAADIICAPAIGGESFGMVLIEALAAGKLVVASRIDGYVAAVGETPCVRWVVPGDADALSTALITALQNPQTWRADALQIASAYDWRSVAERLVDVYHRVQRPAEARRVSHT